MTNEEAIKWIKDHHCPDGFDVDCNDTRAMRMAIEALEKAEKYRWHDLRKNPEDLPKKYKKVLVYHTYYHYSTKCIKGETELGFYNGSRWGGDAGQGLWNTIIAWMPFPEFEEVEE